MLGDPTAYPKDRYQIVFMDSCWSYAYYTKQVFKNKASSDDPRGWALADVVNNTELGHTTTQKGAIAMWLRLLDGAAAVRGGTSAAKYSWNNLVDYLNTAAEQRATAGGYNAEIYGVSGVRTNRFQPKR